MALTEQQIYAEKARFEVKLRFENGEKLQYRPLGSDEWKDATWSKWQWDRYEYRIKPEPVIAEIAVIPYLNIDTGVIVWVDSRVEVGNYLARVIKFVTRKGVRHAVIEVNE